MSSDVENLVKKRKDDILDIKDSLSLGKKSHRKSEEGLSLLGSQKMIKIEVLPKVDNKRDNLDDGLECAEEDVTQFQIQNSAKSPPKNNTEQIHSHETELSEFNIKIYLGLKEFFSTLSTFGDTNGEAPNNDIN